MWHFKFWFCAGVAIGAGWQALVAYVNIACYYLFGIPVGLVLGYKLDWGVKVCHSQFSPLFIRIVFRMNYIFQQILVKEKSRPILILVVPHQQHCIRIFPIIMSKICFIIQSFLSSFVTSTFIFKVPPLVKVVALNLPLIKLLFPTLIFRDWPPFVLFENFPSSWSY